MLTMDSEGLLDDSGESYWVYGRVLDSKDNLESVWALKWEVGLSMITINLDATAIAKQLNCDRTSVYRVLR